MSATDVLDWLGLGKADPGVKITLLPASYFKFPPSAEPTTVPPPLADHPLRERPFSIPPDLYNALLSSHVPITVALVYMSVVSLLNSVNASRKYKPWAFSRTYLFKFLVILHNVFLAVYSAWTCVGMVKVLHESMPDWDKQWKLATTVDALCKMHGPRGAGSAATYNATTNAWTMTNRLFHLAADGLSPESTDVGRIWNEGLAFYGWIFYLSKFYEVIDTLIILAKGKRSSLLQTYHHAGAMLCMWAGIRYMSPPIWMFVLVNSGIHAIMYTFYLLSALGYRVPKWFKQSLTTLQITQFVVGATYAFSHLFVAYQIPVSVPYIYHLGELASKAVSDAPSAASSIASSAVATASAGVGAWLKKAALRAAGYEGLAENVPNEQGQPFGIDAVHIVEDFVAREETRYRDELQWVYCLDTSGQVFAILLNCVYLAPLTWLFLQFFITSYLKHVERRRSSTASETALLARKSFQDASKGVARRLSQAVEEMHRTAEEMGDDDTIADADEIKRELKETANQAKRTIKKSSEKLTKAVSSPDPERAKREFQRDIERVRKNLQAGAEKVKTTAASAVSEEQREMLQEKAQNLQASAAEAVEKSIENVKSATEAIKTETQSSSSIVAEQAAVLKDKTVETVQRVAETIAPSKSTTETETKTEGKAPNGNGTGAEEVTGSKKESKKEKAKKSKEDKIIDESQAVRDEDVKTEGQKSGDKAADGKEQWGI